MKPVPPELSDSASAICTGLFEGTLSNLGRIALLAHSRRPDTRRYSHDQFVAWFDPEAVDRLTRLAHQLLWRDWMSSRLEQQQADLLLYLRDVSPDLESEIALWIEAQPFLDYAPDSALAPERSLFSSNLRLLLGLLHNQYLTTATEGRSAPQSHLSRTVKQAIDIIWARYSDPSLSLAFLSVEMNVSEIHLGRLFRNSVEQNFRQYLRDVRMRQAAELLVGSDHSVKAISGMVGYSYSSHFCEDFRVVIGCTPLEFRSKNSSCVTAP